MVPAFNKAVSGAWVNRFTPVQFIPLFCKLICVNSFDILWVKKETRKKFVARLDTESYQKKISKKEFQADLNLKQIVLNKGPSAMP